MIKDDFINKIKTLKEDEVFMIQKLCEYMVDAQIQPTDIID